MLHASATQYSLYVVFIGFREQARQPVQPLNYPPLGQNSTSSATDVRRSVTGNPSSTDPDAMWFLTNVDRNITNILNNFGKCWLLYRHFNVIGGESPESSLKRAGCEKFNDPTRHSLNAYIN
ncbi:hypothetical protein BYT27DRAFT_7253396 [Phlegmacium glaucopus]|nr:hypothetical protein BYT27DRAFT_7253396 [Phlegmacium glaucopus]